MVARKSAQVTVPSTFVQRNFGELIRRVFSGKEHFIVQKEGLPVMAILSMAEYEELIKGREVQEHEREERLKRFRESAREIGENIEKLGLKEEELNDFIEAARREFHEKRRNGNSTE